MYVLFFYFKFKIKTKYIFKIWDISYHPIFKYFLSIISPIWIINYHLLIFLIFNKKINDIVIILKIKFKIKRNTIFFKSYLIYIK